MEHDRSKQRDIAAPRERSTAEHEGGARGLPADAPALPNLDTGVGLERCFADVDAADVDVHAHAKSQGVRP